MIGPRALLRRTSARVAFGVLVRDLNKQRTDGSDPSTMNTTVAVAKRVARTAGIHRDKANDRLWVAFHGIES